MHFNNWRESCDPGSMLHTSLVAHCRNRLGTEFSMEEVAMISVREADDGLIGKESQIAIESEEYRAPYPFLAFSVGSVSFYYTVDGATDVLPLHLVRLNAGESLSLAFRRAMAPTQLGQKFGIVAVVIIRSKCTSSFDGQEVMSQHTVEMIASIVSTKPEF